MTIAELTEARNRFQQLLNESKPLAQKSKDGELSDEENTRFDEIVEQLNTIKADIDAEEQRREQQRARSAELAQLGQFAEEHRGRVNEQGDGVIVDARNLTATYANPGRRFAESDGLKRYAKQPTGMSEAVEFGSTYHQRNASGEWETRTLVHGTSFTDYVQPTRLPGIVSGTPFPLRMRDVLNNGRTTSPSIEFVVKNATTNNAAFVAEATTAGSTGTDAEKGVKPESAVSLEVKTTSVKTVAHWIPITRQMLEDAPQMEAFINGELLQGLRDKEDAEIVKGSGGASLTGILNTTGVQKLDGTYWGNNANKLASDGNALDAILRGIKQSQVTGQANPTFIAVHPNDYETYRTIKDANGNYILRGGGPDATGVPSLWGLPVVQTLAVTANKPLVGDGRFATVFDKTDGQIYVSDSHADLFTRNILVILAEARLALAVTLPAAFVEVDVAAALSNLQAA